MGTKAAPSRSSSLASASGFDRVIRAGARSPGYWRELWAHRGLLAHLALRDLRVRYKQTALGLAWALIRPLLSMGVITVVFGVVAGLPSHGDRGYALMVLAGLLPWQLFATAVLHASSSIAQGSTLVSRIWFPRLLLPAAALVNGVVDFAVALGLLVLALSIDGAAPGWRVLFVPGLAILALLAATGLGVALAALNVRYRDFGYLTPFLLQLGLFLSPVGFVSGIVPPELRLLFALNPMVGVIDGFRWALLDAPGAFDGTALGLSIAVSAVMLVAGVAIFRRMEPDFVDYV